MERLTVLDIAKAWDSIPKTYWPTPDKPWRVSWGFGAFQDFKTKTAAAKYYQHLLKTEKGDWKNLVNKPFNVHDTTRENLKS